MEDKARSFSPAQLYRVRVRLLATKTNLEVMSSSRDDFTARARALLRWSNLRRIVFALNALENGTYGICGDCSVTIPRERLRDVPEATLCVSCQNVEPKSPAPIGVLIAREITLK